MIATTQGWLETWSTKALEAFILLVIFDSKYRETFSRALKAESNRIYMCRQKGTRVRKKVQFAAPLAPIHTTHDTQHTTHDTQHTAPQTVGVQVRAKCGSSECKRHITWDGLMGCRASRIEYA